MAHYKAIEGFEFHEKVTVGDYDYYVFLNKGSQVLIKKVHSTTSSTRFALTVEAFATVIADPTIYNFTTLDHWKL